MEATPHTHEHEKQASLPTFGDETLKLTQRAIDKAKYFATAGNEQGKALRVYIQGGGCSGFQYGFSFDDKKEGDTVIQAGDLQVLVDVASLPYLKGAQVDFVEDFKGAGFSVTNPNAKGSCGCGTSFTV